ncbi:MAG: MauE/DoxX family redox-associated membrane protein [Phycisphaerales bacterium]
MSALRWAESVLIQLPVRLGLGGLFAFAAVSKLMNIQAFAFAIKGFKVLDPQTHAHLILSAAYTIPWVEIIAAVLLILGLRTRSAALTLGLMLIAFIAGLVHVITSGIHADCSCFGDMNLICEAEVGWCQVIRNLVLLLPALYLIWRGGGILSIDHALERRCRPGDPNSAHHASSRPSRVDDADIRA